MHTSGTSTGTGKLVSLNGKALRASATGTTTALGGHGVWVVALPVNHIAGLQMLTRSVLAGTQPVTVPRPDGFFDPAHGSKYDAGP